MEFLWYYYRAWKREYLKKTKKKKTKHNTLIKEQKIAL